MSDARAFIAARSISETTRLGASIRKGSALTVGDKVPANDQQTLVNYFTEYALDPMEKVPNRNVNSTEETRMWGAKDEGSEGEYIDEVRYQVIKHHRVPCEVNASNANLQGSYWRL